MKKILVFVEGQTEESFVREILSPFFLKKDSFVIPKIAVTKKTKSGSDFKGGIVSYNKVKREIKKLLNDSSAALITTMIDYYGLPNDFPGIKDIRGKNSIEKVKFIEDYFQNDIGSQRFLPYFSLH